MSEINPNIRTYYSWDELERLSSALGISTYDLVVNVMKKSRQDFYRISNNYKNGKRVSLGEHISGALPNDYCKNNVEKILDICPQMDSNVQDIIKTYYKRDTCI